MVQVVDINELQVGMFVHLDLSWMSHPFARSSFRVENTQQIDTIRSLGVSQLRWDPQRSQLATPLAALPAGRPEPGRVASAEEQDVQTRREALSRQREAAAACQAQYEEAGQAWQAAFGRVRSDPLGAQRDTQNLSRALLDKMLAEGELCIRVLNTAAGDRGTAHTMNVAVVAMLLGRMLEMDPGDVTQMGTGALLHDVGKLDIPERLWHVDDHSNAAERDIYAGHVELGLLHAKRMALSPVASRVIAQHHELADGSGFPKHLAGEDIALPARIVSLVNRFDNLCNPPLLALAMTPHEALSHLFANQRSKYDATVLNLFIRMMGVYPAGSVVQLTDGRFALVISVNAKRPLKPRVLVFDPAIPRDEALDLDLDRAGNLGIRRSLRAAQLPDDARDYLAPRPQRLAYFFEPGLLPVSMAEAA